MECNTGVFLLNLRNFYEQLFHRTPTAAASAYINLTLISIHFAQFEAKTSFYKIP